MLRLVVVGKTHDLENKHMPTSKTFTVVVAYWCCLLIMLIVIA